IHTPAELDQLLAGWCQGSNPLDFGYNSTTDEYQARSLFGSPAGALTASVDVALVTQPADPATAGGRRFTYAPVANTAISIPYYVDNAKTGLPITDLRLDARLVAKLLTQSYLPFVYNCQSVTNPDVEGRSCNPNDLGNPASIFDDPEFQQLNFRGDHPSRDYFPSAVLSGNQDPSGAFFPTVLAGNSDLTYELTRWVESDPDARAFLAGKPDPWGMHVNKSYLQRDGAQLYPTAQLQALDPGWTPRRSDQYWNSQGFQATWNPISGLPNVAKNLVGGQSTAQVNNPGTCSVTVPANACQTNPGLPVNFSKLPAEAPGARDLWAITDSADASAFQFPTAALVDSAGNAVSPDVRGMSDALAAMKTNPDKITQYVDHSAEAVDGYPLTEVVYAMVPTCGLTPAKATAISSLLTHVADSQDYGVQPGTLAPGLLALTSAQLAQTRAAARQVSSQSCTTVPPDTSIGGRSGAHTGGPGAPSSGRPTGGGS
ncbi:MAG: hypothetical protein J0H43_07855, partial [Actinobacteria bacterium]|nr:hypothetical protein [Actinomycetota bacterium]